MAWHPVCKQEAARQEKQWDHKVVLKLLIAWVSTECRVSGDAQWVVMHHEWWRRRNADAKRALMQTEKLYRVNADVKYNAEWVLVPND